MPRSPTPRVVPILTNSVQSRFAFCEVYSMGIPKMVLSTLYRLACTYPCQCFAYALTSGHA